MECRDIAKKYEKVDSFLKRYLSHTRYSAVRLIEPCIAVSSEYNKAFKFVVLAEDSLYITENPPKIGRDIREVTKIVNITSVELLNDVPEFLGGDLKYRTHHILITYKKDTDLLSDGAAARGDSSPSKSSSQEDKTNKTTRKQGKNKLVNDENKTLDTDGEFEENLKQPKQRDLPLLKFSPFEDGDSAKRGPASLHHSCSSLDDLKPKNKTTSTRLTVSANASDLKAAMERGLGEERWSTIPLSGSEPILLSSSQKERGLLSSFNGLQRRFRERKSPRSPTPRKKSFQSSGNVSERGSAEDGEESLVIHLYMLLDGTVMLAYIRSTWDNCLLNAALKRNQKTTSPESLLKNHTNRSQVTVLYNQLEKEILNSQELRNTFILVNELSTACQKDAHVKKLFWQSPNLFVFFVRQLKYYSGQISGNTEERKTNRADELEYMIILFECLAQMFRETELVATRMANLKTEKCRVIRDLIEMTIFTPEFKFPAMTERRDISDAAEVLLFGQNRKKKDTKEKGLYSMEIENLSNELTKCQVTVLHELSVVAHQALWFPSDDTTINICWMVKTLESSQSIAFAAVCLNSLVVRAPMDATLHDYEKNGGCMSIFLQSFAHRFLQCQVAQVMNLTKVAETGTISSDDATVLYRLFSVMKTVLQQSRTLREHIQDHYTEEFRYYVNLHTLSKCLSKDCPLTPTTLKLAEDVISLVTHGLMLRKGAAR